MAGPLDLLLATLDNKRRVLGRNLKDLVQDPLGHSQKTASKIKEDLLGASSGDKGQLTELLGNLVGAGIIQGAGSKLWNPAMAKDALEMQQIGYSAEDIWKATGVYLGPLDGKLRQEIADKGAKIKGALPAGHAKAPLGAILDHPELLQAYPDLKDIMVHANPAIKGGSYLGKGKTGQEDITLGTAEGSDKALSTLLHEIQHAVQEREGFSKGSNLDLAKTMPEFRQGIKAITGSSKPSMPSWTEVSSGTGDNIVADLEKAVAYELYKRTGGEAEARAVQARQGLDPTDLWDLIPTESYDISLSKLLRSPKDE